MMSSHLRTSRFPARALAVSINSSGLSHTLHKSMHATTQRATQGRVPRMLSAILHRSSSTTAGAVHPILSVFPARGQIDEKFKIVVENLPPRFPVTLHSLYPSEDKYYWEAYGHYFSNDDGAVNVSEDASVGGTYTGKEPMGLLWSMRTVEGTMSGLMFRFQDVTIPKVIFISVYKDHIMEGFREQCCIASVVTERFLMAPGVRRINIRENGITATLFVPPGPGPFPGIMDLWGARGGLEESRASLLASHGFASVVVQYITSNKVDGTLEYFERAFRLLQEHPLVIKDRVGVIGSSLGGTVALSMAAKTMNIRPRCCVCINGLHYPRFKTSVSDIYERLIQAYGHKMKIDEKNQATSRDATLPIMDNKLDVGRITCPLLLIYGEDDQAVASTESAEDIAKMMHDAGNEHLLTTLSYLETGHLIELPYTPPNIILRIPILPGKTEKRITLFGGKTKGGADAQEDSWKKILNFLRQQLYPSPDILPKNKL